MVVLSVVGRVLMQVGCKKFATTPRLGSVSVRDHRFCPTSSKVRLLSGSALPDVLPNRVRENGQQQVVLSIYSFAPGKVFSSRLVLSCSSHQTDFRSFHLSKVKKPFEAADGWSSPSPPLAEPSRVTYVILLGRYPCTLCACTSSYL